MSSGFDVRQHLQTPELKAFEEEARDFIRSNLPPDIRAKVAEERMDLTREDQQRWHKILHSKGWACPSWPVAYGGTGWSDEQSYIFEREIALCNAPRPMTFGTGMLGPTAIEFGTEEQKARILPGIVNGDVFWCQGFSEPNAGSDLASLQTRAERRDDHYIVNGSKIWTSDGHIADRMFGLFRTDSSGRKQQGITFLTLDMKVAGITVVPIRTFDGGHEVNQVFFEDVRVPLEDRLGEENDGWKLAKYLLGLERFGTAEVSRSMASMNRLKLLAHRLPAGGGRLIEDRDYARRLAEAESELRALELTEMRFLFGPGGADALGAEASMLKVRGTEVQHLILELMVEALAGHAHLDIGDLEASGDAPAGPREARYASRAYFNFRKTAIYSGSNEIQKNIIAKAVLGL
jgi:hypothetical protein